jgi:hypothetical protein
VGDGHLGQQAVKAAALSRGPAGLPLVLVDDQDALPGPTQGDGAVDQGVLPLARLAVVQDLVGA